MSRGPTTPPDAVTVDTRLDGLDITLPRPSRPWGAAVLGLGLGGGVGLPPLWWAVHAPAGAERHGLVIMAVLVAVGPILGGVSALSVASRDRGPGRIRLDVGGLSAGPRRVLWEDVDAVRIAGEGSMARVELYLADGDVFRVAEGRPPEVLAWLQELLDRAAHRAGGPGDRRAAEAFWRAVKARAG
jgi:hypothetical protein